MTNPNSNVTQITDKQPAPSAKFTIMAVVEGFPIQIEIIDANANKLIAMIDRLKAIGAEPPTAAKPESTKAGGAPTCPTHGSQMKASQKPGTFFCPKKNDDGSYCRHKA